MTGNFQKIAFTLIIVLLGVAFMYRYFSPRGKCERQAKKLTIDADKTVAKYDSNKMIKEMFKTVIDNEIEKCLKNTAN